MFERLRGIRDRFKVTKPQLPEAAKAPSFVDGLQYGVNRVTPYIPDPARGFPSVPIPGKTFMPPSLQPNMRIRQGGTPDPSGPTLPEGSIHANGSK